MNIKYKQLIYISIIILILLLIRNIIINNNNIEKFEDKENIELEIQPHEGGLFSNFNKLIYNLSYYNNVSKITYNMISSKDNKPLYFINDNEELFSKLFETYDDGTIPSKKVTTQNYINYVITGKSAYNLYNSNRNKLQPYHDTYIKYIKVHNHIEEKIHRKIIELKENCDQLICIFVRSEALKKEQPSNKMPTREDYDNGIKDIPKSNNVKYFLCIDNNDDLEYYKNKYTPNYFTNIRRTTHKKDGEPHVNSIGSLEELENSFIEVVLMSQCDILVHCVSNMATASLYMNMKQQSICVSK